MLKHVPPRLVTFDVTGTLLMTKLEEHYTEIGSQHGLKVEPSRLAQSFNSNFRKLAKEHPIYGRHTGLGWENWWRRIVHNVFREQNGHSCDETLEKVANSLIACYGTSRCWHQYPGTVDILEYLKRRGVLLGVISNFDERLESVLESTELRPYFSFVLSSYRLGVEKPDPSIFEKALEQSGQSGQPVLPQEAVHIGDRIDNDYLGAKNAQWNAILINRNGDPIDEPRVSRNDVFCSLGELQSHFDTLFQEQKTA